MLAIAMVTFREGLEALLIIAISVVYFSSMQAMNLVRAVWLGAGLALGSCIGLGFVFAKIGGLAPIWEAYLATLAAILVVSCTWHMLHHGPKMGQIIRERLEAVSQEKAFFAVAAVAFLMLGREGLEAAAMLASLATQEETTALVPAASAGLVLAIVVALLWVRLGRKINLTVIFRASAIFMTLFSIQLVIYAFHEFSEANALPLLDNAYWHLATEDYAPEGEYGSLLSYLMAASPFMYAIYYGLQKLIQKQATA